MESCVSGTMCTSHGGRISPSPLNFCHFASKFLVSVFVFKPGVPRLSVPGWGLNTSRFSCPPALFPPLFGWQLLNCVDYFGCVCLFLEWALLELAQLIFLNLCLSPRWPQVLGTCSWPTLWSVLYLLSMINSIWFQQKTRTKQLIV